jgi:class 3 adenylate cyclase
MPKFTPDRFPPGFFDLPADAGETFPVAVIEQWTSSAQNRDAAVRILEPHTLRGAVVSSDSAGLTKLSRARPLVEILALVSRPKELIHAFGRAIGGRAIGVWAADNTQMFYPGDVTAARLVEMLRGVQERLAEERTIGIGMCAHRGAFFELSGGLYGPDADRVETVAEEHTEGGELVITDTLVRELPPGHAFALSAREDLAQRFGELFRVTGGPALTGLEATDTRYPVPFSDDFYEELRVYAEGGSRAELPRPEYVECAVVLVEREHDVPDVPEVAVLNDLALTAATRRIGRTLLKEHDGAEIKNSGVIGIYTFPDPREAVAFAQGFRQAFAEQGVTTRIGIDVGPVLIFDLGGGSRDIAGSPINVASKLAQDCGEFGKIYLSDEATRRARMERQSRTVTYEVSGVTLTARHL